MSKPLEMAREGSLLELGRAYFSSYPSQTVIVLACLVVAGMIEGLGLAAFLPLMDSAIGGGAANPISRLFEALDLTGEIGFLLAIIASAMVLRGTILLFAFHRIARAQTDVSSDLRMRLIHALLAASWRHFLDHPLGRFGNALTNEAERAAAGYLNLCKFVALVIQIAVYLGLAVVISWQVMLVALFVGGGVYLGLSRLVRIGKIAGRQQTHLLNVLAIRLSDGLLGLKPLKAMRREQAIEPLLRSETIELQGVRRRLIFSNLAIQALQEPILAVILCACMYAALAHFEVEFATVMLLGLLFYRMVTRMTALPTTHHLILDAGSAYWSISDAIREANDCSEVMRSGQPPTLQRDIVFENVSFAYGTAPVLRDLDLTVQTGSFVVLIGPSGAGKTTLVDLLAGLYSPQSGRIMVDGVELGKLDLAAWRQMIGYVPQELFLFHDTILANVTLGTPDLTEADAERALRAAGAWGFVSALPDGLRTVVGERGARLSGGQRQRVAIARALVQRPKLLILDEVTASLDPETADQLSETLRSLAGDVTVLAITHQEALVKVADVVYAMESGRLLPRQDNGKRVVGLPGVDVS